MQTRPKITRHRLNDNTDTGYHLFGLVSSDADYKLSQQLNKKFLLTLRHSKSIDVENDGEKVSFSRYTCQSGDSETIIYSLISNKSDKNFLLKKLNKIDYIFQIHDHDDSLDSNEITSRLREIEKITAVFKLDPKEIKDKNLTYLII